MSDGCWWVVSVDGGWPGTWFMRTGITTEQVTALVPDPMPSLKILSFFPSFIQSQPSAELHYKIAVRRLGAPNNSARLALCGNHAGAAAAETGGLQGFVARLVGHFQRWPHFRWRHSPPHCQVLTALNPRSMCMFRLRSSDCRRVS